MTRWPESHQKPGRERWRAQGWARDKKTWAWRNGVSLKNKIPGLDCNTTYHPSEEAAAAAVAAALKKRFP